MANEGRRKSVGAKCREIDWDLVKKLASLHCTNTEIYSVLECSKESIKKACLRDFNIPLREKLDEWRQFGKASLRRKQMNLADKNASMAIFLGKQMLGQKDNPAEDKKFDGKLEELLDYLKDAKGEHAFDQ